MDHEAIADLYAEAEYWHVNTGGQKIHVKRMGGRFRNLKRWAGSFWLIFFLGPFMRWDDRQAVLFDIPNRQYHIFGATVLPQDFWMLSLVLLFFAILLAIVTSIAGRVYCGYFCFQTVWTDVFTWVEARFEGSPQQRRKLDAAPLSVHKVLRKTGKHTVYTVISVLTGVAFTSWFRDVYLLWDELFTLTAHPTIWIAIAIFTGFTYLFAGQMREQVCFWLCPYARIQGVMYDRTTVLPTYDFSRGEPRSKVGRQTEAAPAGDCIDCKQCVAVCPTGIDIRHGQQEGCITCSLCIDACDAVMEKVGKPKGLIRYASLDEIEHKPFTVYYKRPRVWLYALIMTLAMSGIVYGLSSLGNIDLKVLHARQPLYVTLSNGSIQNKYTLKVLNKTKQPITLAIRTEGVEGIEMVGYEKPVVANNGRVTSVVLFLRLPRSFITSETVPVTFVVEADDDAKIISRRESIFVGPRQ
jgi:cytochrome c oxidase accessory protein FixG